MESYQEINNLQTMQNFRMKELSSIGTFFPDTIKVESESKNVISLKDILKNNNKTLIYRYSATQCKMCIDSQLEILSSLFTSNNKYNIILLASNYLNIRDLIILKKRHSLHFPIYLLCNDHLPIDVDSLGVPYFFLLDKDMEPQNVFVPQKEMPSFSVEYLTSIKEQIMN